MSSNDHAWHSAERAFCYGLGLLVGYWCCRSGGPIAAQRVGLMFVGLSLAAMLVLFGRRR